MHARRRLCQFQGRSPLSASLGTSTLRVCRACGAPPKAEHAPPWCEAAHRRTMQSPRHAQSLRAHHKNWGAHQGIHKSSSNKYKSYKMKRQQVHELESPRARVEVKLQLNYQAELNNVSLKSSPLICRLPMKHRRASCRVVLFPFLSTSFLTL